MVEIKIYGTLVNDTAEAIAKTTQVIDPATGKNVNELIEAAKTAPYKPYLAANGMGTDRAPADLLTDSGTEWIDGFYAIGEDDEGFGFYPASVNSMTAYNKLRNYCGIAMEYDTGRVFYFPFTTLAPEIDPGDEHPIIGKIKFMPVLSPQGTLLEPVLCYEQGVGYGFSFNPIETYIPQQPFTFVVDGDAAGYDVDGLASGVAADFDIALPIAVKAQLTQALNKITIAENAAAGTAMSMPGTDIVNLMPRFTLLLEKGNFGYRFYASGTQNESGLIHFKGTISLNAKSTEWLAVCDLGSASKITFKRIM